MTEHDPDQIGRIPGTKFFHDAGSVDLHRARADSECSSGFLVGSTIRDFLQDFQLPAGEQLCALKRLGGIDFLPLFHGGYGVFHPLKNGFS